MENLITDNSGMIVIYILWTVLCTVSLWKIFEKAGQEGWYSLIPFFNVYIIFEKILHISWLNIFKALIPFYNIYFAIWLVKKWANAFGKTTAYAVGLIFMPYIFFPILAFGKARYVYADTITSENVCNEDGRKEPLEKDKYATSIKSKNKILLIILGVILSIIIAVLSLFFINKSFEITENLNNEIAIMEQTKQIEKEKFNNEYKDNTEEIIKENITLKYPNGKIRKIENRKIIDNILTVTEVEYFEDGKRERERVTTYPALEEGKLIKYENQIPSLDLITFEDKEYYISGNIKLNSKGKRLEDGVLEYISEEYYENEILKEKEYRESENNGEEVLVYDIQMYYLSGSLLSKDTFNWQQSKVSSYIEYYESGKVKLIKKYIREYAEEDEIISLIKYSENGEIIEEKNI